MTKLYTALDLRFGFKQFNSLLILFVLLPWCVVFGQINPPIPKDSLTKKSEILSDSTNLFALPDSLSNTAALELAKKAEIFRYPWPQEVDKGGKEVLNDSLWRWAYYSDLVDRLAEISDFVPYRSGIQNRSDAVATGLDDPRFQKLTWGLMTIDDPLSKNPMFELIPINKVGLLQQSESVGISHLRFDNRIYQVNEPWTHLYFDEADGNYQNLEFMLTRNFTRKHNLEIGYRQIRDGNLYRVSDSEANQIFVQNSFFATNKVRITHRFFSNQLNVDEPFGYQFLTASTFSFNPFFSTPNVQSRQSTSFNVQNIRLEMRKDSVSSPDFEVEMYRKKQSRVLNSATDSINYDAVIWGLAARKMISSKYIPGRINLDATISSVGLSAQNYPGNLPEDFWMNAFIRADWRLALKRNLEVFANGEIGFTNPKDSYMPIGLSSGLNIRNIFRSNTSFNIEFFMRQEAPSTEEIVWLGANQRYPLVERLGGKGTFSFNPNTNWEFELSGGLAETSHLVVMPLGNFSEALLSNPLQTQIARFGTLNLGWQARSALYSNYSLHYQQRNYSGLGDDDRLLSRWVLGWKNYAFNKATYLDISAELRNELLPFFGLERDPLRNLWQIQRTSPIPAYTSALDLRLSARLRSILISVRWENLLDRATQLGYFETIGYPAPTRRLLFSVRALFKN